MTGSRELRLGVYNTRRNLPTRLGRKRGEANFLGAFIRLYLEEVPRPFVYARQFAVPGCGIADFVLYQRSPEGDNSPGGGRDSLLAFETKLADWKRALQQAYRYRYYADLAVVLLPIQRASRALASIDIFQRLEVALWTFDPSLGVIRKHVLPSPSRPLNPEKRRKALATIGRRIGNFRGGDELPQALLDRI